MNRIYLSGFLCLFACDLLAQEQDIFELSLEQLINMPVAVASPAIKTQASAPASVTVYDQGAMNNLNRYTLAELAQVTAGFAYYEIYGEKVFSTRGQKAGSFENNKHLVLIDGIPINHARSNKAPIDYELPLFFASNVEFMRGPDSALHGDSAFYGVVNIHSQTRVAEQQLRVASKTQDVMFNSAKDEQGMFVGLHQQEASLEPVGPNFSALQLYRNQQSSQFLYGRQQVNWARDSLEFGLIYLARRSGLGEHWMGDYSMAANDLSWSTAIPFVKYEHQFHDSQLNATVLLNQGTEKGYWAPFTRDTVASADGTGSVFDAYNISVLKSSLKLNWKTETEFGVWQLGLSADEAHNQTPQSYLIDINADDFDDGDPNTTPYYESSISTRSVKNYAVHGNGEFNALNSTISIGLRFDEGQYGPEVFHQVSPRVSVVHEWTDEWFLKFHYRSALRSPGLKEYSLNEEVSNDLDELNINYQLEALTAETFTSLEANLVYKGSISLWQLNVFQNVTENALDGEQLTVIDNSSNPRTFNRFINNNGKITAQGVELEARYFITNTIEVNGNISYAKAKDDNHNVVVDVPDVTTNLWANLSFDAWQFTPFVHYQQAYYADSGEGDGIFVVDLNTSYQKSSRTKFRFSVQNATNEDNYFSLNGDDRIPLAGRVLTFGLHSRF